MAMTVARAFIDTNVLLRAFNRQTLLHEEARLLIKSQIDAGLELWISRQVIREYLVQMTHPRSSPQPDGLTIATEHLETMQQSFRIADETAEVTAQLLDLLKTYPTGGKQVHDANIVATMLVNGVDTLLTMNVDDFRRFEDRINLLPLQTKSP